MNEFNGTTPVMGVKKQDRAFFVALGGRIEELRKTQSLTQVQLADLLGVAQSTVNAYEKGARRVPLSTLPALSRALGVSTEALLGESNRPGRRGPTPKFQQQLERVSRLPRAKQRVVNDIIEGYLKQAS